MTKGRVRGKFTTEVVARRLDASEFCGHARVAETWVMLTCLVMLTGDRTLVERYGKRVGTPAVFGIPSQPPDPEARTELLELLAKVLASATDNTRLPLPDRSVMAALSNIAAGFNVSEDQLDMNLQQAGFVPDDIVIPPTQEAPSVLDVAIIGAGMTGVDAAVKAKDRGFQFQIFEMEDGPGGLWWSQRYPGVAVDTPATFYSLSWWVSGDWSRYFPQGVEYQAYLARIVQEFELGPQIRYGCQITQLDWLEDEQRWRLTCRDTHSGELHTATAAAVLTAAGHLNRPKYPDGIEGIDTFGGESVHTGKWRELNVAGKRVAVVGVGAAGVQVIPSLAPDAHHLTVFQRQAHWISPSGLPDDRISDSERWLRRNVPFYVQWQRLALFVVVNQLLRVGNIVDAKWRAAHSESISESNANARAACLAYIDRTFGAGSELARRLTPNFAFGAKRPVRDPGDYYETYKRPNVTLVTEPIVEVIPEGIVTGDGTLHELDVIVWATGMTLDYLSTIEIVGRDGVTLSEVWAGDNPRTYLGGMVPGFPNLFVQDGPNTGVANGGLGHNFMTETINHYVFECLQLLVETGSSSVEVTQEAHDRHNEEIEQAMAGLIWSYEHGAHTYYRNAVGRIVLPSPFVPEYLWNRSQAPARDVLILRGFDGAK